MKIFVINLDRSTERRDAVFARLAELGLEATRFAAFDGTALSEEEKGYNGRKRRLIYGKDLTIGEIGCARSHLGVYAEMERLGISHALVLEDDALIGDNLPAALAALETCRQEWDLVRFLAKDKDLKRARPTHNLANGFKLCRVYGTPGGAYAYVLTRQAAAKLAEAGRVLWRPIDTLHGQTWSHGLTVRCLTPSPVAPDMENDSTIGDGRFDRKLKLIGWEYLAFPLTRFGFKCFDAVTKHGTRWLGIAADTFAGRPSP